MSLDTEALARAAGLLWGGAMLLTGLANLVLPGYGADFLKWASAVYPGYHGPDGFGSVILVTVYGLVDGAVFGFVLGWLYNAFSGRGEKGSSRSGA